MTKQTITSLKQKHITQRNTARHSTTELKTRNNQVAKKRVAAASIDGNMFEREYPWCRFGGVHNRVDKRSTGQAGKTDMLSVGMEAVDDLLAQLNDLLDERDVLGIYDSETHGIADDSDNGDNNELNAVMSLLKELYTKMVDAHGKLRVSCSENNVTDYQRIFSKYQDIHRRLVNDKVVSSKHDLEAYNPSALEYVPEEHDNETHDILPTFQLEDTPENQAMSDMSDTRKYVPSKEHKSVRFKANIVDMSPTRSFTPYRDHTKEDIKGENIHASDQTIPNQNMRKPYKDSLFETVSSMQDEDELDNPAIDISNKQIFIHNQQQFGYQDEQLDQLHTSIKQQKQISKHINAELGNQFVILNDLEAGLDNTHRRVLHTTSRIQKYRQELSKRGDWMCIIILIITLLFLLVVVK